MIEVFKHFIYAFICAIGFAMLFNAPRSSLMKSGFAAGVGWALYNLSLQLSLSSVVSTFIASLSIGMISEFLAVYYKQPITVYIIPGIVPLVPGYLLYYTMISIMEGNLVNAASHGSEAMMIAIAIAGALTIVLSISSYRRRRVAFHQQKKHKAS